MIEMNIVLYSDDINLLDYWQKSIVSPCRVLDEIDELFSVNGSVVVINYSACIPTCKDVVKKLVLKENRVLILHRVPELKIAMELLKEGAMGYGNALMKAHFLNSAIDALKENMVWLHPEFTSNLILQIEKSSENKSDELLDKLSQREKETALLLKEGFTYNEIASKLDITPRTVKEHAKNIYAKLYVKDRLALALLLR